MYLWLNGAWLAQRLNEDTTGETLNECTGPPHLPRGRHGYLAIEGLVALTDLLSLSVAPRSDELQDGLLVTAWKTGGHW